MEILIIFGLILFAWLLQTILGSSQINDFNKNYNELRRKGRVSIGRSKGIFRSGVVLLMLIDKNRNIKIARKMQGITIFAKFKDYPILIGQDLLNIEEDVYEKMDRFTQKAFDEAVDVFKRVERGEEIPSGKSPLQKASSIFSKSKEER